jgi:uncharacterized OB-fold protein
MALMAVTRDEDSAPFFDATAQGKLLCRRCENGHYMTPLIGFGATPDHCHVCRSTTIAWEPVSGEATLISWIVVHDRSGEASNLAGIVELAEGPWMNALIDVGSDEGLHAGQAVTVGFVHTDGGETIPAFRPL